MSLYRPIEQECPQCGALTPFHDNQSINADRRPDLREAILADTFQREACVSCGFAFRLEPRLIYFDEALGLWIRCLPLDQQRGFRDEEDDTLAIFAQTFGPFAPPDVQALGAALKMRVCFGWAGLREKLLCAQHGLDDVSVEALKVAMLRLGLGDRAADEAELRLAEVGEERLEFVWLMGDMEVLVERAAAPRALLDEVAGEAWADTRAAVSGLAFVDMNRALLTP